MREIDFLDKNFLQGIINFEKKFLNFFVYEELYKNEIIYKEKNPVDMFILLKKVLVRFILIKMFCMINYLSELIKHKNIVQSDIIVKMIILKYKLNFKIFKKLKFYMLKSKIL